MRALYYGSLIASFTVLFMLLGTCAIASRVMACDAFPWEWPSYSTITDAVCDDGGNIYVCGHYEDEVWFENDDGTHEILDGQNDSYLAKYDSSGQVEWVKSWTRGWDSVIREVAVDPWGDVYITGSFRNPGHTELTGDLVLFEGPEDYYGAFLCKLDHHGNVKWVRSWFGNEITGSRALAIDDSGMIYVTGVFAGECDFDPGPGEMKITSNDDVDETRDLEYWHQVYRVEQTWDFKDCFVSKFDVDGNWYWTKTWGGRGFDISNDIFVDINRRIYICGAFTFDVDFDPGLEENILTASGLQPDAFLMCLDSGGDLTWINQWDGGRYDAAECIAVGPENEIYVTGSYYGEVVYKMDEYNGELYPDHEFLPWFDVFLQKYDSDGNIQWCKTWGSSGHLNMDWGQGVVVRNDGSVFVTGSFSADTDFDPGPQADILQNNNTSIFVSKLGENGEFDWAVEHSDNHDYLDQLALMLDRHGDVIAIGKNDSNHGSEAWWADDQPNTNRATIYITRYED